MLYTSLYEDRANELVENCYLSIINDNNSFYNKNQIKKVIFRFRSNHKCIFFPKKYTATHDLLLMCLASFGISITDMLCEYDNFDKREIFVSFFQFYRLYHFKNIELQKQIRQLRVYLTKYELRQIDFIGAHSKVESLISNVAAEQRYQSRLGWGEKMSDWKGTRQYAFRTAYASELSEDLYERLGQTLVYLN